jgi:hypothetical protein
MVLRTAAVQSYCTFAMGCLLQQGKYSCTVFWSRVAVLDPKFAQESESGLRFAQSPAGKDENCMQSLAEIYRQSSLSSRPAGCCDPDGCCDPAFYALCMAMHPKVNLSQIDASVAGGGRAKRAAAARGCGVRRHQNIRKREEERGKHTHTHASC